MLTTVFMSVAAVLSSLMVIGYFSERSQAMALKRSADGDGLSRKMNTADVANIGGTSTTKLIEQKGDDLWDETDPFEDKVAIWILPVKVKKDVVVNLRGYKNRVERILVISGDLAKKLDLKISHRPHHKMALLEKKDAKKTMKPAVKYGLRMDLEPEMGKYHAAATRPVIDRAIAEANRIVDDLSSQAKKPEVAKAPKPIKAERAEAPKPMETAKAVPAEDAAPVQHKPSQAKQQSWVGKLVTHGFGERAMSGQDGKEEAEKGKVVNSYRAIIKLDNGDEETVWGTDIRRAITDAKAENGDRIELLKHGKRPLENNKWMTIYSATKLA